MSSKQFFVDRYGRLGWNFHEVRIKPAIRINTVNSNSPSDVEERLQGLGLLLSKIPFAQNGFWVEKAKFSIGATVEYLLGLYSIQEAASQLPATLFNGLRGKTILDGCAAPGGKTTQLADLMGNTGMIVALDVEKRRLIALSNQLERCRIKNTVVYEKDARKVSELDMHFDRILLDMPCSGNFAMDEVWFRRRTLKDVMRNAALQKEILAAMEKTLKDGGEIVYSTCSLEPEENELNIDWAINNLKLKVEEIDCYGSEGLTDVFGLKLDNSIRRCRRIWPGVTQGFFICELRKGKTL